MTLDPKALEKAARELCAAEGHKDHDTMIFAAFAHDKPPRPRWTFYEGDASTAVTAYLAATKATAPDPAPVSGWRLVPVEPTKAQIELLAKAYDRAAFDPEEDGLLDVAQPRRDRCLYDARELFHLLLAAAPEPPKT